MSRCLALFGLLAIISGVRAGGTGDGTAYSGPGRKDQTGFNSCQFGNLGEPWESMYAALPSGSFDRELHCGQCIRVKGLEAGASGNWVVVKIVDECATCSGGDVDFSTAALEAITGFNWDRKKIRWEFCPCSGASAQTEEEVEEPAPEEEPSNDDSSSSNNDDDSSSSSNNDDDSSSSNNDDDSSSSSNNDDSSDDSSDSDSSQDGGEITLEGDLNGNGKLSRSEKRKLARKQQEEEGGRKLLRLRAA